MLVMPAVPRALCQPSSCSAGTISSSDTSTPAQPLSTVCTRKVISPPSTVPITRPVAACTVWSSLSSTTITTASSGYQRNAMRSK